MTARDAIVRNKVVLQDILCEDPKRILDTVMAAKFITPREQRNLASINQGNVESQISALMDKIIGKPEDTCKAFVDLLQTDAVITEIPKLADIQWGDYAGGPSDKVPGGPSDKVTGGPSDKVTGGPSDKVAGGPPVQELVCDDQYKLSSNPTGLCAIFNNEIFPGSPPRAGTNQDAVDLARTFSRLGFRVLMFKDQTKIKMEETLKLLASLEDPGELQRYGKVREWFGDEFTDFHVTDYNPVQHGDAFVCCVMSHGEKGCVSGTDWGRLSIDDITATFSGLKCPLLDQKPKVFFIEACQKERQGQPGGQADNPVGDDAAPSWKVVQAEADFLVAMSTVDNHEAKRHTINGTWFMQCLWKRLHKLCPSGADLMTILYRVNDDVAQKGAQMPVVKKLTLRKKLVFTPISN